MIVFGFAEIVTGFTHEFFGLRTSQGAVSAVVGGAIGACYAMAGFLILTMGRRAALMAIVLLVVVVAGRVAMVVTGLYPLVNFRQVLAIILGTAIAAGFALYIGLTMFSLR